MPGMLTEVALLRRVELEIELTNGNDGRGSRWFKTATVRKKLEALLREKKLVFTPFAFPVRLRLTRLLGTGQRYFDEDSLGRGNSKELIDAMVVCGWFHDDCRTWIRKVEFEQAHQSQTGRKKPGVLIEIFKA